MNLRRQAWLLLYYVLEMMRLDPARCSAFCPSHHKEMWIKAVTTNNCEEMKMHSLISSLIGRQCDHWRNVCSANSAPFYLFAPLRRWEGWQTIGGSVAFLISLARLTAGITTEETHAPDCTTIAESCGKSSTLPAEWWTAHSLAGAQCLC